MRADRLVSILLLLQVHGRMTARELAQRLEVSQRTIHRDMEALCAAGVPLYAERGTGGGWVLPDEYKTNLTGLREAEVQALFLSKPARVLADLGLDKASDAAFIKLLAALPSMHRRDAQYVSQRIYVDAAGWHPAEEDLSALPVLQEGIWQERKLLLSYQRGDGASVERLVDPLGLVAKGRVWYLIAAVDGELRTYRVGRVRAAQITDQPFVRPPGFDLAAHWEQSKVEFVAGLPRYPVIVRADPGIVPQMRHAGRYSRVEHVEPPAADGWVDVQLRFELEEDACAFVLGFGPQIEVLAPLELRRKVIELVERISALYTQSDHARLTPFLLREHAIERQIE